MDAQKLHTMPTFSQLPSGKWRAQVRRAGIYRAATFTTKREARDWATTIEAQANHVAAGGFAPVPKASTVKDLIEAYQKEVTKAQGKTKASTLEMLKRTIGAVKLSGLNSVVLRDFIDRRQKDGAGGVTIAGDLSFLSTILKWARHSRNLDVPDRLALDARAGLKYRGLNTRSNEREREPTDDELRRIFKHWTEKTRQKIPMETLVRFALATGMRQAEICRIQVEDVDRDRQTVIIRDRKDPNDKTGNDQTVPLLPDAWAILSKVIEGRTEGFVFPYKESSVSASFTRACKDLRPPIIDLHFHDLRHRATAQFFRMGLGIPQVSLLTGHKTWTMLKRYTAIKPEDVHAAIKKPASPAPAHAGQQGDGQGDISAPTV